MHYRPLAFVAVALTILACDREAEAQSPAGQAYRVHIVSSFGTEFNDGFFYNADGTLLLTQLGGGTWRGLFTIPFVAALHTAQSTNGRITLNYIAVTFPATGARLRGVGFSNQGETFTLEGTTISKPRPATAPTTNAPPAPPKKSKRVSHSARAAQALGASADSHFRRRSVTVEACTR